MEARATSWRKYLGGFSDTAEYVGKFVNQLKGDDYMTALATLPRAASTTIEVDRLRVKPIVKITGEFWAQTTEGDGNFNMFHFLEREGAQVLVEPIGTWIMYMIHQVIQKYNDFKGLEEGAVLPPIWQLDKRAKIEFGLPPEGGQAEARRGHLQARIPQASSNALGGIGASPRRPVRAAAPRPSRSTTRAPAAAKATWKSPRTSTTRTRTWRTWCCR